MARPATNVCWASLTPERAQGVQDLIDTKPPGWQWRLREIVGREVRNHEGAWNYRKAGYLQEWSEQVIQDAATVTRA